jgi:hypothetical protein
VLDVAYETTYYGGGTESESATPIELKGGEQREIDVRLTPVPALHAVFRVARDAAERGSRIQMPILQRQVFDLEQGVPIGGTRQVGPGEFEITGVPAGRYEMRILNAGAGPGDGDRWGQVSEVDLTHDGQELNSAQGEAFGKLKVTVKVAGQEALPREYSVELVKAGLRREAMQQGDADGKVTFDGVRPGKYSIWVVAPENRYAVVRLTSGTGEMAGREVTVAPGASAEVTAEVVEGEIEIEGVVEKKGKAVSGVMVALVPNDPEAHVELFRRDQSDFDGTFSLRGVVPGTYTVVAVEDAWGFDWLKAGVLARYVLHGQQVIVADKRRGLLRLPEAVEVQGR